MALNYLKNTAGKNYVCKTSKAQLEALQRYRLKNKIKTDDYNKSYYEANRQKIKEKYEKIKLFNELPFNYV